MLFDTTAQWTDIHFGLKGNDEQHNKDCIAFIKWSIEQCKQRGVKKLIFTGDYFHNRQSISLDTLNYGLEGLRLINEYFEDTWFLVGNHDMFYKNRRDVTSTRVAEMYPNIHFISEITVIDDCTFVPFLIDEEFRTLGSFETKFVFGHLELPGYMLNKMVMAEDHGKENEDSFSNKVEYVITGHYHKRQYRKNSYGTEIHYTGNCFPHDFSDTWDDERGMSFISQTGVEYVDWPDCPKYRSGTMSDFLSNPRAYGGSNIHAQIQLDIPMSGDTIAFIRELCKPHLGFRSMLVPHSTIGNVQQEQRQATSEGIESIDNIVLEAIRQVDTKIFNVKLLEDIYMNTTIADIE